MHPSTAQALPVKWARIMMARRQLQAKSRGRLQFAGDGAPAEGGCRFRCQFPGIQPRNSQHKKAGAHGSADVGVTGSAASASTALQASAPRLLPQQDSGPVKRSFHREAVTRISDQVPCAFGPQPVPECMCGLVPGSSGKKGRVLWNSRNQRLKVEHFGRIEKRHL